MLQALVSVLGDSPHEVTNSSARIERLLRTNLSPRTNLCRRRVTKLSPPRYRALSLYQVRRLKPISSQGLVRIRDCERGRAPRSRRSRSILCRALSFRSLASSYLFKSFSSSF